MAVATLVFSFLQPLEDAVRWLLDRFHYDFHLPWAWSIVATTVVVRILLVPLTVKQIHSMQAMQAHMPALKEIQKKYKGDRAKLNEETMKFYRENNVNPAASCLPMVAQFPVFISLYLVLKHFHAPETHPDLSWLHIVPSIAEKASAHWSGYLLLVIYAGSQILSTWFMSTTMEKSQRTIMLIVPLIFISVIANFPAGLVLYWVTTNLWTVGQGVVTRQLVPKAKPGAPVPAGPKRSSRTPPESPVAEPERAAQQPRPNPVARGPRRVKRNRGGPHR
ncbi:MAG: membrane protein insertase YidC [Actinomycetes bacterium]